MLNSTVSRPKREMESRIMRSSSPFTVMMKRSQREMEGHGCKTGMVNKHNEKMKIHRTLLNSEVEVEFLNMISPSLIFVRQLTHVADEFDLHSPYPIKKALRYEKNKPRPEGIAVYNYYMAPRIVEMSSENEEDEIHYSRCRLLDTKEEKGKFFGYVFYIDHGYGTWLNTECLGEMPKKLYMVPWQAIPVALLGISPTEGFGETRDKWTKRECSILESVLKRHKKYLAKPVICKLQSIENYSQYARVELQAITDPDQKEEMEESIEEEEAAEKQLTKDEPVEETTQSTVTYEFYSKALISGESIFFENQLDELTDQKLFTIDNEIPDKPDKISAALMKFPDKENLRKSEEEIEEENKRDNEIPGDHTAEELAILKAEKEKEELNKWDPKIEQTATFTHQIPDFNAKDLNENDKELESSEEWKPKRGEEFELTLNVSASKSPHDFYGYLIKKKKLKHAGTLKDSFNSMLRTYDKLDEWQGELDHFYLNSTNCKPLDSQQIHSAFSKKQNVFAIFRISDNLEQTHFVRIKIVEFAGSDYGSSDMMNYSVQLLDRGGTIHGINGNTLLRLHSKHSMKPAQVINFCLPKIVSPEHEDKMQKNEETWTIQQRQHFQLFISIGAPMKCRFIKIDHKNVYFKYGFPESLYTNVCYIEELRPVSNTVDRTVEISMIEKKNAVVFDLE